MPSIAPTTALGAGRTNVNIFVHAVAVLIIISGVWCYLFGRLVEPSGTLQVAAIDVVQLLHALDEPLRAEDCAALAARFEPQAVDDQQFEGGTLLHLCSSKGKTAALQFLLGSCTQSAALLDVASFDGGTPLMMAAANGHLDSLRLLLFHGANASARDHFGDAPLHVAARQGDAVIVDELLRHGAPVDAVDQLGESAWQIAHCAHAQEAVQVLEAAGAAAAPYAWLAAKSASDAIASGEAAGGGVAGAVAAGDGGGQRDVDTRHAGSRDADASVDFSVAGSVGDLLRDVVNLGDVAAVAVMHFDAVAAHPDSVPSADGYQA